MGVSLSWKASLFASRLGVGGNFHVPCQAQSVRRVCQRGGRIRRKGQQHRRKGLYGSHRVQTWSPSRGFSPASLASGCAINVAWGTHVAIWVTRSARKGRAEITGSTSFNGGVDQSHSEQARTLP